jgi:hypothetical protein
MGERQDQHRIIGRGRPIAFQYEPERPRRRQFLSRRNARGGELLDASRSKRFLVVLGGIIVAVSALAIALWPSLPVVFEAEDPLAKLTGSHK